MSVANREYVVHLREPYEEQRQFISSPAKRVVVRAGRRGGKTVGAAIKAVQKFLDGRRVLYGVPTIEQLGKFWFEVCKALEEPIRAGVYKKNEVEHTIELIGTENRIKGKTVWNADSLRGDYADFLILDEFQLMSEDAWEDVGAPMMLDTGGEALFIYTPPSLKSSGISKARDPRHASKLFKKAQENDTGRWKTFTFASFANPYLNKEALVEIVRDMSDMSYRKEILAEDEDIEMSWLVYQKFNDKICKVKRFPIPEHWPIFVGHDFGGANPAALFIAQDPSNGYYYSFREYLPGGGKATIDHIEEFQKITEGRTVLRRLGGSHQEEEIREAYRAHGWYIEEPSIHKIVPQVDRVISLMETNKWFVFDDLFNYLGEIMSCMWKLDNDGKITNRIDHEDRYHLSACARYVATTFTPETVKSGKPRTSHSRVMRGGLYERFIRRC